MNRTNRLFSVRVLWLGWFLWTSSFLFPGGLTSYVAAPDIETSRLWGLAGERWERGGRLSP